MLVKVLFRVDDSGEVTAVFPEHLETEDGDMLCYAHIGQHSACSLGWYHGTRPAKPAEYQSLLAELREVYESDGADKLKVIKRRPSYRQAAWRNPHGPNHALERERRLFLERSQS